MENQDISTTEIEKKLSSNNNILIIEAIENIRNQGDEKLLANLFELLISNNSVEIQNKILECISDLKDKKVVPFLISALKNQKFSSKKRELLNAYWQTNFDFSEFIDLFIEILLADSFEIGIEALTLIEIISENLTFEQRQALRSKITLAIPSSENLKKSLLEQAVLVLV